MHAAGNLLWQFKVGSGIICQPITYKGPGREAVCRRAFRRGRLGGRDRRRRLERKGWHGALGFVNAMADLPNYTTKGGMLYVFSLP